VAQQQDQCTPQGGSTAQVRMLRKGLQCSSLQRVVPLAGIETEDSCSPNVCSCMNVSKVVTSKPSIQRTAACHTPSAVTVDNQLLN
jgi:hypothetical protein